MKKLLTFLCVLMLALSMNVPAFADFVDGAYGKNCKCDKKIITTIPAVSWTLVIPADTSLPFGTTEKDLGDVEIKNIQNQIGNKHIRAYLDTNCLFCLTSDINTTFPFDIYVVRNTTDLVPERAYTLRNKGYVSKLVEVSTAAAGTTTLSSSLKILVDEDAWNSAALGKYAAYLTFTSRLED